ncbi:response regulator [Aestuariicella sp. G3-2]|uniref:hybrid sensor histidine kinase/response regulator n=1 Tax=Pseudomaricurvus albidus TaxID=2842452 RepID=UPI001C0D27C2|nr:hybrid sensor histidine kinase/response regulator [Aestuariicella albida]MBU3069508.1 response regulator [Aestuariicella albida]
MLLIDGKVTAGSLDEKAVLKEGRERGLAGTCVHRILVMWLFACGCALAFDSVWAGGNHALEQITLKDGLSQSTVFSVEQDSTGFMWFGTRNGLNRFDGFNFRHFYTKDGIPSSFIWSLLRDGDSLWLGTQGGGLVQRQANGNFISYPRPQASVDDTASIPKVIVDIQHSRRGGLWLATQDQGLQYFDKQTGTFTAYNDGVIGATSSVLEDEGGNVWVGTANQGLLQYNYNAQHWQRYRHHPDDPKSLSHNSVWHVLEDSSFRVWVATLGGGLNRLNPLTGEFIQYRFDPDKPDSLSNDFVWTVFEDRLGHIWVGTNDGLNLLDPSTGKFEHFLQGQEIKSIFESRSGILWVGTYYGGVFKLDEKRNKFQLIKHVPGNPNSLSSDTVNGIYEEQDGTLWVVGDGGGLDRIDRETGEVIHYRHNPKNESSISNNHPMNITRMESGDFLLGNYAGGMNRFDPRNGKFTRYLPDPEDPQSIADDTVFDILQDRQQRVWVATWRGGLNQYFPETETFAHYRFNPNDSSSIGDDYVQTLLEDSQGRIWVGTASAGLNLFLPDEKRFIRYPHKASNPESISHNHVYTLFERDDGKLWVGTEAGGLNLFDPETEIFQHFMDPQEYLQTAILGILEDHNGILWISTRDGLLRYNPVTNFAYRYDEGDGVQSREFIAGSFLKGNNGRFYFGGVSGLNYFYPAQVENNRFVPPVVLTRLSLTQTEGKSEIILDDLDTVVLQYDEQPLTIGFAALNYTRTNLNRYRYKMEGLDDAWLSGGKVNQAMYHRIAPGDYQFKVRGSNNDGVWNAVPATLNIKVLPPWWLGKWAFAGYFLGVALLVFSFMWWRQRALQAERECDIAKRSELAKQEFLAKMSHEIRTPLSGMLGMGELLEKTQMDSRQKHYLRSLMSAGKSLLSIINDILEFSKIDAQKLELIQTPFRLQNLIEDLMDLFSVEAQRRNISLNLNYPKNLTDHFIGDPTRLRQVLSNLLGNAVKFTEEGGVWIQVDVQEQSNGKARVRIELKDSGIGIDKQQLKSVYEQFYQAGEKNQGQYGGTGLGLSIAKQLVELMGGSLTLESDRGVGTTATVILTLPVVNEGDTISAPAVAPENFRCHARILIAEDDKINADTLMHLLTGFGCDVVVAKDGQQVLDYLESADVDLIFMDRHMPVLDGIAATKCLRASDRWQNLPILAITASISLKDKAECLNAGMNEHLLKPLLTEQAIQVLMKYCPRLCIFNDDEIS